MTPRIPTCRLTSSFPLNSPQLIVDFVGWDHADAADMLGLVASLLLGVVADHLIDEHGFPTENLRELVGLVRNLDRLRPDPETTPKVDALIVALVALRGPAADPDHHNPEDN